ncbi:MAG TPA: DUF6130 family protein [Actinomycetota bacterium]|nr:DUF6130 family protein [Actinomycetota bacterium]
MSDRRIRHAVLGMAAMAAVTLSACGGGSGAAAPSPTAASAARPSSPAKLTILSPRNGQVIRGTTLDLELALKGAKVVPLTTTDITPTTGHVHVYVDGKIVSMTAGLGQTVGALTPGQHTIRAEFVAADHRPFNPRVFTDVVFEVKS